MCMLVNQKENLTLDQESFRALFHAPFQFVNSEDQVSTNCCICFMLPSIVVEEKTLVHAR